MTTAFPTQLYVGKCRPTRSHFRHAIVRPHSCKPYGGLWTSTYLPDTGSAWVEWCEWEQFNVPEVWRGWLLQPLPTARVYTVDSYADLARLYGQYGGSAGPLPSLFSTLHWGLVGRDYDGVHLTEAGQEATRLSMPYNLYGWDCESTLFLRWVFAPKPEPWAQAATNRYEEETE